MDRVAVDSVGQNISTGNVAHQTASREACSKTRLEFWPGTPPRRLGPPLRSARQVIPAALIVTPEASSIIRRIGPGSFECQRESCGLLPRSACLPDFQQGIGIDLRLTPRLGIKAGNVPGQTSRSELR